MWVASDEGITRVGAYAATLWTMIQHLTLGIQATRAGTRITAMLLQAGQVQWTLRIACALRTTGRGHSHKLGQARAHGLSIDLTALCIGSTWRGLARIGNNTRWWRWHWHTLGKGIARHSCGAVAHGHMLMHLTDGIGATSTWTRIHTLLTNTSQVRSTFRAQDALGTATQSRITKVTWQTAALTLTADGVGTTWHTCAEIFCLHRWRRWWCLTRGEGVTS